MDTLKQRHYGNILVYDMDGDLIFIANNGKADFYLSKGLAYIIDGTDENPTSIRLNFKTNGKGHHGDSPFYLTPRKDECVICAKTKDLTRHHVIPHCYRKHMPEDWKSHDHHDVVLLCIECHQKTEKKYLKKKNELINRYGLSRYSTPLQKAVKAAFALKTRYMHMPDRRKKVLTEVVESYLGRPMMNEDIDYMCDQYHRSRKNDGDATPKEVVARLESLEAFIREWRTFFLYECGATNLPSCWSVYTKPPEFRRRDSSNSPLFSDS